MGRIQPIPASAQPKLSITLGHKKFDKFLTRFLRGVSSSQGANALLKIGLDVLKGIIQKNPVDTGRSRAGWYFGYNKMVSLTGGSSLQAGGSAEQEGYNKGKILLQLSGSRKSIQITNQVVYVGPLEYGWSKQAPYGMLRITMQLMRNQVPKHILADLQAMWKRDGKPMYTPWRATSGGPKSGI